MTSRWRIKRESPQVLRDYEGMNWYAAKAMGFHGVRMNKRTILVDQTLKPKRQIQVIKHEIQEAKEMSHGKKYWDAHLDSLRWTSKRRKAR